MKKEQHKKTQDDDPYESEDGYDSGSDEKTGKQLMKEVNYLNVAVGEEYQDDEAEEEEDEV